MADNQGNRAAKAYYLDIPDRTSGQFHVKGAAHCDWGMKRRLGKIFRQASGNTVMLAFDHGYIMGPTAGLERLDIALEPLIPHVDVLMGTRGAIRTSVSPLADKPICLRVNFDSSVLYDDMSGGGGMACDLQGALRMDPAAVAVQTFVGAPGERNSLDLLARTVNMAEAYGIPTLGVVAVGKDMDRDERFFLLATRMLAEQGAQLVKSYYCDGFERVAAACPVPIVIAGGKKQPERDALAMAYRAISDGARGVDMGRNIFQAEDPAAMCQAVSKVVHEGFTDREAFSFYEELRRR